MMKTNVIKMGDWLRQNLAREMTPEEACRAVRRGRLKRRSLKDLDQVIDEMARRAPPEFLAELDAIIAEHWEDEP